MEILLAAAVGAAVGWVMGRRGSPRPDPDAAAAPGPPKKLSKRQREILAALPPDPPRRTIEDLMNEEAADTGVDRIPDAGLPLPLRLRVWHRDRSQLPDLPVGRFRYAITDGIEPDMATDDEVRLVVDDRDGTGVVP